MSDVQNLVCGAVRTLPNVIVFSLHFIVPELSLHCSDASFIGGFGSCSYAAGATFTANLLGFARNMPKPLNWSAAAVAARSSTSTYQYFCVPNQPFKF